MSAYVDQCICICRYKADVKYENDPEAVGHQIVQTPRISRPIYVPQRVQVSSVPVRQFGARGRVKAATSYDYITEETDQVSDNIYKILVSQCSGIALQPFFALTFEGGILVKE